MIFICFRFTLAIVQWYHVTFTNLEAFLEVVLFARRRDYSPEQGVVDLRADPYSYNHNTSLLGLIDQRGQQLTANCNTIQYNTIQYNTIQYNTIRYDTIRYDTIRYDTIRYDTIRYDTIQYNTIQYNTIQYNTIQYNTIQYNTIQ